MGENPKEAVELQEIVDQFNQKFDRWTREHGARATFGWQYGTGEKQVKAMEILGIDKIIWRKPPPKGLGEIMNDQQASGSAPPSSL